MLKRRAGRPIAREWTGIPPGERADPKYKANPLEFKVFYERIGPPGTADVPVGIFRAKILYR